MWINCLLQFKSGFRIIFIHVKIIFWKLPRPHNLLLGRIFIFWEFWNHSQKFRKFFEPSSGVYTRLKPDQSLRREINCLNPLFLEDKNKASFSLLLSSLIPQESTKNTNTPRNKVLCSGVAALPFIYNLSRVESDLNFLLDRLSRVLSSTIQQIIWFYCLQMVDI